MFDFVLRNRRSLVIMEMVWRERGVSNDNG